MQVGLTTVLSDSNIDSVQSVSQRQLAIVLAAVPELEQPTAPLNLCLILDQSGSMDGQPLERVKQAAQKLLEQLAPDDRIAIVSFDHKARVLVPNQVNHQPASLKLPINQLRAGGGTAIDEGLRLGIEELAKARKDTISQALLLTDGENEHGDNDRCLKLAKLGAEYGMTINTLGFGDAWNQDVLESIADAGGGSMVYIEQPDQASQEFTRLFQRAQTVGLTNAHLLISLMPGVRLAELKPLAQVAPDTIELTLQSAGERFAVRLGDLMTTTPRVVLANLYLSQLPIGEQAIAEIRVRYDDPAQGREGLLSDAVTVTIHGVSPYQPAPNPEIQPYILALAKYRQTQIAESKLQRGDVSGAATMLQTAAKTALQMGDGEAATVLQTTATRLQSGEELSEAERKKTRMASKTTLQSL